ncbi:hypothetical protein INT44_002128 [Umbelopsis vinacea]|uniref:Uncharacterized protein n=1 Tax=Umbelopsis vinacea TaxID=44442 RepID=A0A8H7Q4W3_9FUNG|nr:hypothetical protein INT44_002128 [Umbelopsis vinacea]
MYIPIDKELYLNHPLGDDVGKDPYPVIMQVDMMTACFGGQEIISPLPTTPLSQRNSEFSFGTRAGCEVSSYRIGNGRNARPYRPKYHVPSDAFEPMPHKHMPYPNDPMEYSPTESSLPITIPCNFYVRTSTGLATLIACRDLTASPVDLDVDACDEPNTDNIWSPETINAK